MLSLIQSAVTGLFDDEAYYWVYSKFLDWGYFDHPPMIALLIKCGYAIFPNELGVRLLIAIMSTGTLWLISKLLNEKDYKLFYCIALSMAVLQIGGFLAVPDIPLMFFAALFFLSYKKFVSNTSTVNAVVLGIAIALMLYSKYHGALIVLFTIASNPGLLRKYPAYVTAFVSIVLLAPHIYWQYQNGFPSVQYHLFERNASQYRISFTLEYIAIQLLIAGPLTGFILLWAAFRKRPVDPTEKALKFTTVGLYLFFLIATLKGRAEANWTFPAFIGLIVLGHQYLLRKDRMKKTIYLLSVITLSLVLLTRIYMIGIIFPGIGLKGDEFLHSREWVASVRENAKGLPVFFSDSYQRASRYWFYSGQPTYSLNTIDYRRNNFNFWKMEDSLTHKKMYNVYRGRPKTLNKDSFNTDKGWFYGAVVDDYFSFSRIMINCESRISGKYAEVVAVPLRFKSDEQILQRIAQGYSNAYVWMAVYRGPDIIPLILQTDVTLGMIRTTDARIKASVRLTMPPGKYKARFAVTSCLEKWPTINSSIVNLTIEE